MLSILAVFKCYACATLDVSFHQLIRPSLSLRSLCPQSFLVTYFYSIVPGESILGRPFQTYLLVILHIP